MALHHINRGVSRLPQHQVDAHAYRVDGDFIHFVNDAGELVLSIAKSVVQTIERS